MRYLVLYLFCVFGPLSLSAAVTNTPAVKPKVVPFRPVTNKVSGATSVKPVPSQKPAPSAVGPQPVAAPGPDDPAINTIMTRFESTVKSGDFSYPIQVMYTPVLDRMGGKVRALAAAKDVENQMKAQKIGYVSWKPAKTYTYVSGKAHKYVIVRYEALFDNNGKKVKIQSYLLGIKVNATTWQFVNGDDLSPAFFEQFLPDFPRTVTLPRPQTTQLP